jgi:hypothetical protein
MQGQELGTEGIPAAIPPPTLGASFHHATTQQQVPSSAPRLEGVLDTRPQPSQSAGQKYTDQHPAPADPRGDPCVFVASGQRRGRHRRCCLRRRSERRPRAVEPARAARFRLEQRRASQVGQRGQVQGRWRAPVVSTHLTRVRRSRKWTSCKSRLS